MSGTLFSTADFWRVNSYGYPNPFREESKSQEAWTTFQTFVSFDGAPYNSLKAYWASSSGPRKLDSHGVESWKATFEEFGLLYVISRSDVITITPGGKQILQAFDQRDEAEFVWVGLNLLFRYPLQGPPRGTRRARSEILPYRFLYSAMRDLGDYFWFAELERIFCRVFFLSEATSAVQAVRDVRDNPSDLTNFPLPAPRKGAFYNSLNQVANHAGLNHMVLTQDNTSEHYHTTESRRRHHINRAYLSLVSAALGDPTTESDCRGSASYVDRLPSAPAFTDEQEYFDYLGAPVASLSTLGPGQAPLAITLAGDSVFILKEGKHYSKSGSSTPRQVQGKSFVLCRIARNHRIILSDDLLWTYLVMAKNLIGPDTVQLTLRRARPIVSSEPILALLEGEP